MKTNTALPIQSDFPAELAGRSSSSTQRAYQQLRQRIIVGEILPGERLKVESLKLLLNTGATPIREALSLLTSDQLVDRIDQRGFRVAPASKKNFQEILMLRCQLEDIALRSSIELGDAEWEEGLLLSHHRLNQADRADPDNWERLHRVFHTTLLQACGSPILLRFCEQLYDLNIRYRYLAGKSVRYQKRDVIKEHQSILDAVLERDTDMASCSLLEHYTATGDFLTDKFKDDML